MIVLAGGDLVLPDRILAGASLLIEGGRIVAVEPRGRVDPSGATLIDTRGCLVAPGFIDVHVHGVDGYDTLDDGDPLVEIAGRLPRYGVTAFAPTTVACSPVDLGRVLGQVRTARAGFASTRSSTCR